MILSGRGLVHLYSYADAHVLKTLVHNRNKPGKPEVMQVEYTKKVIRSCDELDNFRSDHLAGVLSLVRSS